LTTSLLQSALAYAGRGWPVFPLKPADKTPMTRHGHNESTCNENIIRRWWDQWPEANVGIAVGAKAGFWVLDVDGENGSRSLVILENEFGPLPETLEQRTGGGGRQLFFRWRDTREVRNKQSVPHPKLPKKTDIDIRGEGGYIVAPPSIHPDTKQKYDWPYGDQTPIADAPLAWLDFVAPKARKLMPWERVEPQPLPVPSLSGQGTPVVERARRYLSECEPAIQGAGGHNALLWAARAMVVGFQLDDRTALALLWSEFNPRCSPPWNRADRSEVKDFERKIAEARRTPGEKPSGWLLDEYGLRTGADVLAQIAQGQVSAANLLGKLKAKPATEPQGDEEAPEPQRAPFPLHHFPEPIADYCRQVAKAHVVDESFVGLPALVVAGAAMGNAWRLWLKKGFTVPPTIWGALVGASGTNKSGPLDEIVTPLRTPIPIDQIQEAMLNPQGRTVVSDATLEAVIARMGENPRGLLVFRDELAGWAKSFNAYKRQGGDEQAWLEFWGAKEYTLDRKTDNEQKTIPAASCCVLGGIQPRVLVECCDPGKMASGLVPRILIACPPASDMYWSAEEVDEQASTAWHEAVRWLRSRPFAGLDPNTCRFAPHIFKLSDEAQDHYVGFFNQISHAMSGMANESSRALASKARVVAGRLILIHHGLTLAARQATILTEPVSLDSAEAGCAWAQWFLDEQMRVFGFSQGEYARQQTEYLYARIAEKCPRKQAKIRDVQRLNPRKYESTSAVRAAMSQLVEAEMARWLSPKKEGVALI